MFLNEPKPISIDVKGLTTGQLYQGIFKIKPLLSHRDKLRRDELRRQLLGAQPDSAGEAAQRTAEVYSKIYVHLIDSPGWWKDANGGLDLLDEEPVVSLIEKIIAIEQEIVDSINKQGEEAKKELTEIAKQAK